MPRGDKSAYTEKQIRKAEQIEEGYKKKGVPTEKAESRAWATVNKEDGGGKKSGSGRKSASSKRVPASAKRSATKGTTRTSASAKKSARSK